MRVLDCASPNFNSDLDHLLDRSSLASSNEIRKNVEVIINEVIQSGDAALARFSKEFDDFDVIDAGFEISNERLIRALESIDVSQRDALEYSVDRVRSYHEYQKQDSWSYREQDGTELGQKITPLARVGLYVPGGKASYPSSVIMNAVPAKVAGVNELVMVSPTPNGQHNDMVLAAAKLAGVDRVFRIGGAQAIAALAYGTESIPRVDKITGPGNVYVATAKQLVFGHVGIDMLAGPSEVLIIADDTANPDWVAMDMFAQAEHDEMAQAIFMSTSKSMIEKVRKSIARLLPDMPRKTIIERALNENGALILVSDRGQLVEVADNIAAEHLEIFTENADQLANEVRNAGAIFIGEYSAESLGDYCAGPNHVLPTSGTARFSSPLGVYDFVKRTSMIKVSPTGAQTIGKNAAILAHGESLSAHAKSAEFRLID